jgi:hypothetical protein
MESSVNYREFHPNTKTLWTPSITQVYINSGTKDSPLSGWDWYQRRNLRKTSEYDTEPTGEPKWIRAVTLTIWNHCYQRWQTRCDHQYGQNQTTGFKQDQLLLQITSMYTMQDNILSSEKYIFQTPMDDWKDKTRRLAF